MSVCTNIELVETLPTSGDLLRVTIDNSVEAYWFYSFAESTKYLNQEVIVEYRQDIYKGALHQFIATFIIPTVVNTLEKKDNIKLYIDSVDNQSNLSFSEIAIGETKKGCIVYCVRSEFKSSSAAIWQELLIRDKSMHVAKLRLFDYDNKAAEFSGRYVMTELTRSKFGFQSEIIYPVEGECQANPEIDIAIQYIKNYFSNDVDAMSYISKYNLIESLREIIDYEPGYSLVRLAMELSMVDSMFNITKDVDLVSIGHALLAGYGYHVRNSELSPIVNNVILASSVKWKSRVTVMKLLDNYVEDKIPERYILDSIKDTVNTMLIVRKGVKDTQQ